RTWHGWSYDLPAGGVSPAAGSRLQLCHDCSSRGGELTAGLVDRGEDVERRVERMLGRLEPAVGHVLRHRRRLVAEAIAPPHPRLVLPVGVAAIRAPDAEAAGTH